MTREPTFLFCVGAAKAGTSWLYRYLFTHPECYLRAIKELHYFDTIERRALRAHHQRESARLLRAEARRAEGDDSHATRRLIRDLTDWVAVLARGHRHLPSYRGYLTQGLGDRRLVADVTPGYALLSVQTLQDMARMAADVRFLYLLRDPVARMWSQARMIGAREARDDGEFAARSLAAMDRMLSGVEQGQPDREDYRGTITRLKAAVAPDRLLILLQDEMHSIPGLARLCRFLGIAPHPADAKTRENEGLPLPLPEDLHHRARRALRPQYDFVATLFPALPDSWRQNMTEVHP